MLTASFQVTSRPQPLHVLNIMSRVVPWTPHQALRVSSSLHMPSDTLKDVQARMLDHEPYLELGSLACYFREKCVTCPPPIDLLCYDA